MYRTVENMPVSVNLFRSFVPNHEEMICVKKEGFSATSNLCKENLSLLLFRIYVLVYGSATREVCNSFLVFTLFGVTLSLS